MYNIVEKNDIYDKYGHCEVQKCNSKILGKDTMVFYIDFKFNNYGVCSIRFLDSELRDEYYESIENKKSLKMVHDMIHFCYIDKTITSSIFSDNSKEIAYYHSEWDDYDIFRTWLDK